ncbi:MAG: acyl-CoA thioesterase [Bacteroidales bacterium]
MENKYSCQIEIKVRDYECDAQGIVNNANYQHYFEIARHEFLEQAGCSFANLRSLGIEPVVARIEIDYKNSLHGGELFICNLFIRREGVRFIFFEDIFRASDNKLCASAKVITVCTSDGKIVRGDELAERLKDYL